MEKAKHLVVHHAGTAVAVFAGINLAAGCIGMILYGAFSAAFGPVYVMNQFIGLWLTSLMVFYSICCLYHYFTNRFVPASEISGLRLFAVVFDSIYYCIVLLMFVLLFIGFAMGRRIDGIVWSLLLCILIGFILFNVIWENQRDILKRKAASLIQSNEPNLSATEDVVVRRNKIVHRVFLAITIILAIIRVVFIVVIALLIAGAWNLGVGVVKYPPRGKFATVTLTDGRPQTIHYLCEGPLNSSFPVYMFEADGTHGMADFWGLQRILLQYGRRSCVWDKPGLGYSDYLYVGQNSDQTYYYEFMKAMGEKGPFIFVGWGGGGPIIYEFATLHPEMVHSLVLLDVAPMGVEWSVYAMLNNLTSDQKTAYMNSDLQNRYVLFNAINGLGVPWGFMGAIMPISNFAWPPELREERHWYMTTEKTWASQLHWLRLQPNAPNVFSVPVNSSIPVHMIMTAQNDTMITQLQCTAKGISATSDTCLKLVRQNQLYIQLKENVVLNRNGGTITRCTEAVCDLGYYVFGKPDYTINTLNEIYRNTAL
jgi:pimeloyl-ACP methyl ester carboxylesterase